MTEEDRHRDPDDWWANVDGRDEPEPVDPGPADRPSLRPPARLPPLTMHARVYGAVGLGAIILIFAGLFAAGAFDDSGSPTAAPLTHTGAGTTGGAKAATTTRTGTTITVPGATTAPATTLKPGDNGTQVKLLQRALERLGYKPGTVDGDYGTATKAAVEAFQKDAGLVVDGVLGPKTLAALKRRLG